MAETRLLATGFGFTEGPLFDASAGEVIFSDLLMDVRRAWHPQHGLRVVKAPTHRANGLAFDREHRLIACEHTTSRVVREEPDGECRVLADRWDGRQLNSPNDVIVSRSGQVYFTDPTYGRRARLGLARPTELNFQGVYRIDPATGGLALLATDFVQPNGLCLAPDERTLYVADTERAEVRRVALVDGAPAGPWSVFAGGLATPGRPGRPDGMACTERGDVLVTGPQGIHAFTPEGVPAGVITVPERVHNMAWGGPDRRDLYITAGGSLYVRRMTVRGAPQ
ncbi:SMP-30/gluconolactonase/LRE family protein [Phytohabitans sp. ZYX-F-186]|uniref:SMP-30/gluconolactonase/LRE family protein n=1 Tax=Phytohabitans maris TaxID=3071409 RepID=A0ABU0ZEQ7_9ACTN|nr:SMP-30/gluconolactonase/LRE family protein [Phytohabitans sp. ZYX-F-186]MDQ7904790.1 SMP-30/gluconolactonase/LRE family protein [Phytohabitans sp. ZYX-F-186]